MERDAGLSQDIILTGRPRAEHCDESWVESAG